MSDKIIKFAPYQMTSTFLINATIVDHKLVLSTYSGEELPDRLKDVDGSYIPAKVVRWCIDNGYRIQFKVYDVIAWFRMISRYDTEHQFTRETMISLRDAFTRIGDPLDVNDFPTREEYMQVILVQ